MSIPPNSFIANGYTCHDCGQFVSVNGSAHHCPNNYPLPNSLASQFQANREVAILAELTKIRELLEARLERKS